MRKILKCIKMTRSGEATCVKNLFAAKFAVSALLNQKGTESTTLAAD
jgi:hypothetical protein